MVVVLVVRYIYIVKVVVQVCGGGNSVVLVVAVLHECSQVTAGFRGLLRSH
jgi:hypothetical protein